MRRRLAIAGAGLLALLVAVALSQPLWLAPWVGQHLSAASGRSVRFERMWVGLTATLEPVIHARGVRIANAAWADPQRPFAELDEAVVVFSWRSLHEHRPVLRRVVLREGRVDLEHQADGTRNWRLRHPEDRGPGRVRIMALQAERATVRFVHRGLDLEIEAAASPNAARSAANPAPPATAASAAAAPQALPTHLDFRGSWRGVAFTADVESDEVLTFLETGRTFALRGRLEAGGARLDVDGRAGDVASDPVVDARVALAASTLAPFRAFLGAHHAGTRALRLAGRLVAADRSYTLSALEARVGASDFAGEASYAHREERSFIRANLHSESTHVVDLVWLAGRAASPEPAAAAAARRSAVPGRSPSDVGAWRRLDGELRFEARHLHATAAPALQGVKLDATLADGLLKLSGLELGVAQGRVTGQATLDLRQEPARAEADIAVQGVRLEALWRGQAPQKRVTGALHGQARLQAVGDSIAALRAGLSGRVSATLAGGTISSLLDAEMGLQGGKILRSLIGGTEPLAIQCAAASVDLRRGVGTVSSLVIDTERTRTTGGGTIDLTDATLDLVLTPQAKRGGLFVLDRSIRLHGPLLKPEHALIERIGSPPGVACAA